MAQLVAAGCICACLLAYSIETLLDFLNICWSCLLIFCYHTLNKLIERLNNSEITVEPERARETETPTPTEKEP